MDETAKYFDYLVDVIGIKSILLEPNDTVVQDILLLIKVENLSRYDRKQSELLEKMITALQVESANIKVVDFADSHSKINAKFVLKFVVKPDFQNAESNSFEFVTYSPEVLLTNAQLKKSAWDEMQKLVAQIKSAQ